MEVDIQVFGIFCTSKICLMFFLLKIDCQKLAKQNVPTAFGSSSSRRTSSFTCNCQPKIPEKNGDPEKHVYLLWLTPLILTMKCQQKHCWNLFWIFLEIYHLNWWALSVSIHVIFTRIPGVYSSIGIFTKCFQFNAFGINKVVLIIFLNPKRSIGEVWNHSFTQQNSTYQQVAVHVHQHLSLCISKTTWPLPDPPPVELVPGKPVIFGTSWWRRSSTGNFYGKSREHWIKWKFWECGKCI